MSEYCQIQKLDGRYKKCGNQNIHLSIMKDGEEIPLCYEHWCQIADSDREW